MKYVSDFLTKGNDKTASKLDQGGNLNGFKNLGCKISDFKVWGKS